MVHDAFLELAGPALKMVVCHGIGYDKVQVPVATARGILAANTPGGPTEGTAEHAVALMLAVAKGVARAAQVLYHTGDVDGAQSRGIELKGRTPGLVGSGSTGRRVAEICSLGFGMTVVFDDPFLPDDADLPGRIERAEIDRGLLARSDVVLLQLGLSPETNRLIGAAQLAHLPEAGILVDTSHDELVDATASRAALAAGRLF